MSTLPSEYKLSYRPVTEYRPLSFRRGDGQLEGRVEIVLLFVRTMDHLPSPNHQEAGVTEVTRVEPVTPPIQDHDTGSAASCKIIRSFSDAQRMSRPTEETYLLRRKTSKG